MPLFATMINMVEVAILLVAFGSGMAAAILIGITGNQFNGMCILSATVAVNTKQSHGFLVEPSSYSRCQFCVVVHVVGILLALVLIVYRVLVICSGKYDIQRMGRFIFSIAFGLLSFLLLVDACLVTVGLKSFCSNLEALEDPVFPDSCAEFQDPEFVTWYDNINGAHFFNNLTAAGAASWVSLLLWLALTVLSIVNFFIVTRRIRARRHASAVSKPES